MYWFGIGFAMVRFSLFGKNGCDGRGAQEGREAAALRTAPRRAVQIQTDRQRRRRTDRHTAGPDPPSRRPRGPAGGRDPGSGRRSRAAPQRAERFPRGSPSERGLRQRQPRQGPAVASRALSVTRCRDRRHFSSEAGGSPPLDVNANGSRWGNGHRLPLHFGLREFKAVRGEQRRAGRRTGPSEPAAEPGTAPMDSTAVRPAIRVGHPLVHEQSLDVCLLSAFDICLLSALLEPFIAVS